MGFPLAKGQPRTGLSLWPEIKKRAGIEDVRLHDLRRAFADQAVLQGAPLPMIVLGRARWR